MSKLIYLSIAFAIGITPVRAAVVTSGCSAVDSCTMQELFDGGSITVGRLLFDNWTFVDAVRDPGFPPQPEDMIVTGLEDGGFDPGPGLRYAFDDELTIASGGTQFMTFRFHFTVEDTLGQAILKDHTLEMIDFINAGNPGEVEGQLNVRDTLETLAALNLGDAFVESVISDSAGVNVLNNPDQVNFAPQTAIRVRTTVNGTTIDQLALEVLDQRFSLVIPEPGTISMFGFGTGALLVGLWTRHRRRKLKS